MTELAVSPRAESRLVPAALLAGVVTVGAAGWIVLTRLVAGMDAGPGGDPGALGWFAAMWAAMTAAMMLPASAPAMLRLGRTRRPEVTVAAISFGAGYALVWMVAGLAGYAVVEAIRGLGPGVLAWSSAGRYLAGATVAAAGLYQLTTTKRRWLAHCVAADFVRPRDRGAGSAILAGAKHGGCCVACCWALMVALYALGMMSLAWMAVVTVLIAAERLLPPRSHAVRAVAVVLIVLGIAVAGSPGSVPGLTIPSPAAPAMMMRMA